MGSVVEKDQLRLEVHLDILQFSLHTHDAGKSTSLSQQIVSLPHALRIQVVSKDPILLHNDALDFSEGSEHKVDGNQALLLIEAARLELLKNSLEVPDRLDHTAPRLEHLDAASGLSLLKVHIKYAQREPNLQPRPVDEVDVSNF